MVKYKLAYALSAVAMTLGCGGLFPLSNTNAVSCPTAESLAVEGVVSDEPELRYAMLGDNDISEVKLGESFSITCTNESYDEFINKDFTLDLNGQTLTAQLPWTLDIETVGKTLTIKDSVGDGTFEFNDAGIWVDNGANLTIESGTIRGTGGRGRGVVLQNGGKFLMNSGSISGSPVSYADGGRTYWYNLIQVLGENSSAEINGGEITVESGDGRAFYSVAADTTMSNGEISSLGNYAVEVDRASFVMNSGSISSKQFGVVLFDGAHFVMKDGFVSSDSIAISGNGTSTNDTITIEGGVISSGSLGIYAPQIDGVTTVTGGTIKASTGIEVRAGSLNVTGGSIMVSDGIEYKVEKNGSGSTTTGAAVAVAQHTTRKPINVNITGGTFVGPVAFSEADPQDGDPVDVNLLIDGGVFVGDIVSESYDLEDFVKGGDFDNYLESDGGESSVIVDGPVVADTPIRFMTEAVDTSTLKLVDETGSTIVSAYDFSLKDNDNVTVSVNENDGVSLKISVALTNEQYEALKDKKVMVAFFNEDGVETGERIEATLTQREDGVWVVTFVTNHLSTYGIIGVDNGSEEEGDTTSPETGTMTAQGASAANAAIVTAVAVGLLTSIISFTYLIRRR